MDDDAFIDDIAANIKEKKKVVKSGAKGKGAEREIVKILNDRFADLLSNNPDWGQFSRSVGSGNRWGQNVVLPKHAKDTFSGDLCVPENFKWVIESKKGYNDVDIWSVFDAKCKELMDFLKQSVDDSKRCGRKPMVIWKKDRKARLAFLKKKDAPPLKEFSCCFYFDGWVALPFDALLDQDDSFFFSG